MPTRAFFWAPPTSVRRSSICRLRSHCGNATPSMRRSKRCPGCGGWGAGIRRRTRRAQTLSAALWARAWAARWSPGASSSPGERKRRRDRAYRRRRRGQLCGCGGRGHLESYASRTAITFSLMGDLKRGRTSVPARPSRPSSTAAMWPESGAVKSGVLAEAIKRGDELVTETITKRVGISGTDSPRSSTC